jgi:hypothetical protein
MMKLKKNYFLKNLIENQSHPELIFQIRQLGYEIENIL